MSAVSYPPYLETASPESILYKWLFSNRYGQQSPMPCLGQPFGHHLSVRLTRALAPFIFLRFRTPIFRSSTSHRSLQLTELPARIAIMDRSHEFYQLLQWIPSRMLFQTKTITSILLASRRNCKPCNSCCSVSLYFYLPRMDAGYGPITRCGKLKALPVWITITVPSPPSVIHFLYCLCR